MILADYAVIPVDGVYALAGVHPLLESIRTIRNDAQTNLTILGILITQQDGRTNESKGLKEAIIGGFGKDFVFNTHIPRNAAVKESQMRGKTICDENPKSPGCAAYSKFTSEMLTRIARARKLAA
jgi:cellulose biosynthesis protein BcsQ